MKRFLLVQLGNIGDLILTTPAIKALREAHPDAHLTLLTVSHSAEILRDISLVDELVMLDRRDVNNPLAFFKPVNLKRLSRMGHFDSTLIFAHFSLKAGTLKYGLIAFFSKSKDVIGLENGNGWFLNRRVKDQGFGVRHQAQYWLDLVGLLGADTQPRATETAIDRDFLRQHSQLSKNSRSPRIVIHPGCGDYSYARRWDAKNFAELADALYKTYKAEIVLVGTAEDNTEAVQANMHYPLINLSGKTNLKQLAAVIESADLYVGADSGITHLASAVGTPIIALFGPTNHAAWGPWTPEGVHRIVRTGALCSPCNYLEHSLGLKDGCEAITCMKSLSVRQVFLVCKELLNEKPITQPVAPPPSKPIPLPEKTFILGLPVHPLTYDQWMLIVEGWIHDGQRAYQVCTTNPEFMMIAQKDILFHEILARADLCIADGVGLLWAAKYIGQPLPQRVTGSDGTEFIAKTAAQKGWRVFLLGAAEGVAEKTAHILQERYPGLVISGYYAGSPQADQEDEIVALINQSKTDILLVAYGAPKQDKWIARNLPRLELSMAMGVGGSFDFIAGVIPRAPEAFQKAGLEWLYRLIKQPWRAKRMLRLPKFVLSVLRRGKSARKHRP